MCGYIFYLDTHLVWIGYIIFKMFLKSTYPNVANTQGYVNVKIYTLFITLDICKKYLHLELDIFSCMGKKHRVNMA